MKAKVWIKYFVYLLLIIGAIKLKGFIEIIFQNQYNKTYQFNHLLYAVIILATVLVGVIIGLDSFLRETEKEGIWKVNLPKIIFVILPSLIVSLFYIIAMISNNFVNLVLMPVYKFFGSNDSFTTMFQLILGYSLITVMYKESIKNEEAVVNKDADEIVMNNEVNISAEEEENGADTEVISESVDVTKE